MSTEVFDAETTFEDLGLRNSVLKGVEQAGFKQPTHIQSRLIGPMLEGKDILGQAKTGTGKTAAFSLPILHQADPKRGMQALVLAPTRELASQLSTEINELGRHTPIKAISIVGGESYSKQEKGMKGGAQIFVGTPGRVIDWLRKGQLKFQDLQWVVLDEVDRMLDIGFREDIRKILGKIKKPVQTVFVSATIGEEIEKLARQFMREGEVEKVDTPAQSLTVDLVTQKYCPVNPWDKKRLLLHLLTHEEPALTVVFCRTKRTVDSVAKYLQKNDVDAHAIHGDLPQNKRNRIIERLRSGKLEVLIASDVAARGLDIEGISHIINYDLPDDPEVYVHRIGRTARAGRSGTAWSFVAPDQGQLLTEVEKLTNVQMHRLEYPDFEPRDEPPEGFKDSSRSAQEQPPEATSNKELRPRHEEPVFVPEDADADNPDPQLFPGGVVPKGPPRKNLGARFKTRRR